MEKTADIDAPPGGSDDDKKDSLTSPPDPLTSSPPNDSDSWKDIATSEEEEESSQEEESLGSSQRRRRSRSVSPERTRSRSLSPLRPFVTTPSVDTLSNAVANFFALCCCFGVFCFFVVGSYDYFKNVESNKCEMTYMFQMPNYVQLPVGSGMDEKYPMYKLYAYVEGNYAFEVVSRPNYRFNGIPVLYIPGNAGSHEQVRSLASVALRKYLDASTPFHFDFFTVGLNEEFSGLYGYTLERQVEFTKQAVLSIVNLYEDFHRVVLIGHSMGGIIAKAVAVEGSDDGITLSNLIYTLATPHTSPGVIFDPELDLFYFNVRRNWTISNSENKVTLVSVAGGDRDFLVASKLTRWPFNTIHVQSTGVPGVWASTDHLCIVWCKQLILATVRSLFDLVELQSRNKYHAITDNEEARRGVLNYHFVNRRSGKSYYGVQGAKGQINLQRNVDQVEVNSGMYCVPAGQRPSYVLFPVEFLKQNISLNSEDDSLRIVVLTTNPKDRNWIMGCLEYSAGQCAIADNLSQNGKIVPHIRRRRKMATLRLSEVDSKYSHLVVKMDPHPFKTCVMLETYSETERTKYLGGDLNVSNQIFYNLTLSPSGFLSYLMVWKVDAVPADNMACPHSHNLLAQFNHGTFQESRFLKNESLVVRYHNWNVSSSHVIVLLEPTCNYTIKTTLAPVESAGQLFRLIVKLLPSFCAAVILMTLYFQKDPNNWSSFHVLLISNAYHLSLFPGFMISILFACVPTDWPLVMDQNEVSVAVPIVCFMIAYSVVFAVSTGTWYAIITGGTAIHSVIIKVLSSRFGSWIPKFGSAARGFSSVTEHMTEAAFEMSLTRFPVTVAVLLLCLSFATCGSLGIAVALVLYLVKLFKMYEDLLEDLLKAKIANVKDSLSPMNFHFSSFMLWLIVAILNIPALLHWTRSHSSEPSPQWDLSMYMSLLLLPTVGVLWQDFVPRIESSIWNLHRYAFYAMGASCVLWGTHRFYITSFLITFVFLTMAICQLLSVMITTLAAQNASAPQQQTQSQPNQQQQEPEGTEGNEAG